MCKLLLNTAAIFLLKDNSCYAPITFIHTCIIQYSTCTRRNTLYFIIPELIKQNEAPPLPNVTRHSGWWPSTVTPSIDQALHQFLTYSWSGHYYRIWLFFYLIARGFLRAFATGAACQQRTLTPLDTWSCPTGTCKCSNVETNFSWTCLVSGLLSFEHPSVLLFFFANTNVFIGVGRTCMYKGHSKRTAFITNRAAQSVEHQATHLKDTSPTMCKNFSFCILSLSMRSCQVDWAHTNEIKHNIHPR